MEESASIVRVPSSKDVETGDREDVSQGSATEAGPNKLRVLGIIAQAVKRFQGNYAACPPSAPVSRYGLAGCSRL